jgi:hypothetical protein
MRRVLLATSLVLAGCSDSDPEHHPPADVDEYCKAVCVRIHECDDTRDQAMCTDGCKKQSAAAAPKLRPNYILALESCVLAKDCGILLAGGAVNACAAEVNATLAPSPKAIELCDTWEATTVRCGGSVSYDKGLCLLTTKQYSDGALDDTSACLDDECTLVTECIRAALGLGSLDNSCHYASDGECDEPMYCAPGTDSADCDV